MLYDSTSHGEPLSSLIIYYSQSGYTSIKSDAEEPSEFIDGLATYLAKVKGTSTAPCIACATYIFKYANNADLFRKSSPALSAKQPVSRHLERPYLEDLYGPTVYYFVGVARCLRNGFSTGIRLFKVSSNPGDFGIS